MQPMAQQYRLKALAKDPFRENNVDDVIDAVAGAQTGGGGRGFDRQTSLLNWGPSVMPSIRPTSITTGLMLRIAGIGGMIPTRLFLVIMANEYKTSAFSSIKRTNSVSYSKYMESYSQTMKQGDNRIVSPISVE